MPRSKSTPGAKPGRAKKPNDANVTANPAEVKFNETSAVMPEKNAADDAIDARTNVQTSSQTNKLSDVQPNKISEPQTSKGNDTQPARTSELKAAHESKPGAENRKFEVVKGETRKNVVPINLEDEIRRRAYELYEERGARAGSEAEDWFNAEREVRQRYRQQSA
jgi:Protein of unknown function (DUF2934)